MFQLYRIDLAANRKYAVGNPNELVAFLLQCLHDEYLTITPRMDENGDWNVSCECRAYAGKKAIDTWRIEKIHLDKVT